MLNKKQVYTNIKFTGFNPTAVAAVVVADTQVEAAAILNLELTDLGLPKTARPEDMVVLQTYQAKATILCDGDY